VKLTLITQKAIFFGVILGFIYVSRNETRGEFPTISSKQKTISQQPSKLIDLCL